MSTGRRFKNEL